ncbi:hypothetical protein HMPREF0724_10685 [Prescottella equi ATCC 33707]|uniref:DUF4012 domain-containing protein n=1 Tax=Prescottella equi ATCC 33707 TaxID=525370 RepID=E9SX34_RHOHA|nr:hypothetical protein HMPREF0724_10685 [Prescottella equi ATCC 33707]
MIGASCAVAAVVAWGGYVAFEAMQVKSNLERARDHATTTKDALLAGNSEQATLAASDAARYAERAQSSTDSLSWRVAAAVPWLGSPLETTRQITGVVRGLTDDVLTPAVQAGSVLSPDRLISEGARIDLGPLREAAPALADSAAAAAELAAQADAVDGTFLGAVDSARIQLQEQTADLSQLLGNVSTAAEIVPSMMGADGPRTYFIGFQTNAEARGTGGLLGGFGELRAVDGAVRVEDLGSNKELSIEDKKPLDLGPDFEKQYGISRPTTDFRNSNVSSHFPYAAQIWRSLWSQESGEQVDGVIATDPVALSYILDVVGPVTMPDGEKVTADNVVELTESTAYSRFANDNNARKAYLQTIAGKVVERITGKISNPQALLEALGRAASERRIAVWSANPTEQQVLEGTVLGHTVPDDPAPYAGVVVNNLGGNKLDYYLQREIDYTAESCVGDTRRSTVTIRLTNTLPPGDYTKYVAGMFDNPAGAPVGTNLTNLSLVATQGAKLNKVTVDGKPAFAFTGAERGHPVFDIQTQVRQGQTVEVKYELTEPAAVGEARVPVQALVDAPALKVDVPQCGTTSS